MGTKVCTAFLCGAMLLLAACDGRIPMVQDFAVVVPQLGPPSNTRLHGIPAVGSKSLEESKSFSQACKDWITEEEINPSAETDYRFSYRYRCEEGGDVALVTTLGQENETGGGAYTTTYDLRDGSTVVWLFTYHQDLSDVSTTIYVGNSNQQEHVDARYRAVSGGGNSAWELWVLNDGIYELEGTYSHDKRFNGVVTFDDPSTELNPDRILKQVERHDGTLRQEITSYLPNLRLHEVIEADADRNLVDQFTMDDIRTPDCLDFEGIYSFLADGSGEGSYVHLYEDGSALDVEQSISMHGDYIESWLFDDIFTDQTIDQKGVVHYQTDGTGEGEITTYVVDGDAEICDLYVAEDGTSTVSNCRSDV